MASTSATTSNDTLHTVGIEYRPATKKDIRRVKVLAQRVGRLFYDDPQILLLDQLCTVEIIPAEVLASRVGRTIKEIGAMLLRLLEDRLVAIHRRTEIRDPSNPHARPVNKSYYYISYPRFLKVIRWRMMSLNKQIQEAGSRNLENKGFICPRCGKTYDSLDVANLYDPFTNELCCDVPGCGSALKHDENREEARKGQEKGSKFMEQCSGILRILASLEGVLMPHFDPEEYITANLPLETWKKANMDSFDIGDLPESSTKMGSQAGPSSSRTGSLLISSGKNGLSDARIASRPLSNVPSESTGGISVRLVGNDPAEEAAAQRARELQARKEREQNQLPEWHLASTISGEQTSLGLKEGARRAKDAAEAGGQGHGGANGKGKGKGGEDGDEDDYYAQYAQLQDEGRASGGGQTLDEDDLEFEDVTGDDDIGGSAAAASTARKRERDSEMELEYAGTKGRAKGNGDGTDHSTAKKQRIHSASSGPQSDAIVISDDEEYDGVPASAHANTKKGVKPGSGTTSNGHRAPPPPPAAADEEDFDFEEIE
ncbi:hypothetical protein OC846_004800 [Tilletia horrida]|uniref:HTH TFE/IIEalpha-type domain-containing protein n=1 Tax=Tilletia horrida TaxID=155126 RepID=A0AAN6JWL6_9BASI|nr:hypothetical protein OC846_004800 [Tilletia horrida]KAK0563078.1 hypothetical protein OC861_004985 [Tilletia horrida]